MYLAKMSTQILNVEYEFDFILIGISSPSKDYKLGWDLNRALRLKLARIEDILKPITIKKVVMDSELIGRDSDETNQVYSHYRYSDLGKGIEYDLVSNKSEIGLLIPEQKLVDYFFIIRGVYSQSLRNKVLGVIKKMINIQTAFSIDANGLKSKEFLIMND